MIPFIKKLFIILPLLGSVACSTAKVVVVPETATEKLDKYKTNQLVQAIDSLYKQRPVHFFARIGTKFADNTQSLNFKTSIRLKQDSVLLANMSFMGIPVYNARINKDTVTIVDKRKKCYSNLDIAQLKESFGVDFEHRNIEEILLGLPVEFSTDNKYFQFSENDTKQYILSSKKKRKIKKSVKNVTKNPIDITDKELFNEEDMIIKYFLSTDLKTLDKTVIESVSDSTIITISYLKRELIANFWIPKNVEISVNTPRNSISIILDYEKIEVDVPQDLILAKPENYGSCN